jgi:hypothetical protein
MMTAFTLTKLKPVSVKKPTLPAAVLDNFSDANGIDLSAHTMDAGVGWNPLQGHGTIQSSQLQALTSAVPLMTVTPTANSDGALAVDVVLPASGDVCAGLLIRQSDVNTGWATVFANDGAGLYVEVVQLVGVM